LNGNLLVLTGFLIILFGVLILMIGTAIGLRENSGCRTGESKKRDVFGKEAESERSIKYGGFEKEEPYAGKKK
jgi:hypothetical protein